MKVNSHCVKCKHFWIRDEQQRDCPYCQLSATQAELEEAKESASVWEDRYRKRGYVMEEHAKALEERDELRTECERLKEEKALFADEMLRTLAGIVCTPVEGYNQGKFGWMLSDVRSLRKLAEQRESELAALRRGLEKILAVNSSRYFTSKETTEREATLYMLADIQMFARDALGMGEK